jgi:ABC-2 type transport system permease protein
MTSLAGTWHLARMAVRRDRVRLLLWVAAIIAVVLLNAVSTVDLYPTQHSLDLAAAAARGNPAALAFTGPDVALDTIGGQVALQVGATGLTFVGLMSLLLVVRLTRAEEDSGRLELVRSMPVGRHASLAAALLVVGATNVVVGALTTLCLLSQGLPVGGSVVMGASFVVLGLLFAGLAATTAQVTENPRVASGLAGGVLAASFLIRAVGDAGSGAASWASPIGLAQKSRPYGGDVVWPLLLCLAFAGLLAAAAVALSARRDFGAGLVAPQPGPAQGSDRLATPLALAYRLQRGAVLWWTISLVAMAVAWGSLANSIDEFTKDNQSLEDMFKRLGGAGITDGYLATTLLFAALVAAGAALQIVTRVRSEETGHRADPVLATPTSRARWAGGHLVTALAGSGLGLVAAGLALGITYGAVIGDAGQVGRLVGAALVYLPSVWLFAALAVALIGLVPGWTNGAWAVWGVCVALGLFGTLIDVPEAVLDLSPFEVVPTLPAESMRWSPVVAVALVAVALAVAGFGGLHRRDVA